MNKPLERKIYRLLIQHTQKCKVHKAFERALHPFILIDPKQKAKDIVKGLETLE